MSDAAIRDLASEIRACTHCHDLPFGPKPVFQWQPGPRLGIFAQAPGVRAHTSGRPFTDASGVRLRAWLGLGEATFYDPARVALIPMGFCFPGHDAKGGDLPPRIACAARWRSDIMALLLPTLDLALIVGRHAMDWHLPAHRKRALGETVRDWRVIFDAPPQTGKPRLLPLPHPSWRNTRWLRDNAWFETELLPELRAAAARAVTHPQGPA